MDRAAFPVPLARSPRRYGWVGLNIIMVPVCIFLMPQDIDKES